MPENRVIKVSDGISVHIRWQPDEDGDLSHLGEFHSDANREYRIDTKNGVFLGQSVEIPEIEIKLSDLKAPIKHRKGQQVAFLRGSEQHWWYETTGSITRHHPLSIESLYPSPGYAWSSDLAHEQPRYRYAVEDVLYPIYDERGFVTDEMEEVAEEVIQAKLKELKIWVEEPVIQFDENGMGEDVFALMDELGDELLADDLGNSWEGFRYHRYYSPGYEKENFLDDPEEYTKYALQDFDRLLKYGDYWSYMGLIVKVYVAGAEISHASIWNVENDQEDSVLEHEYVPDMVSEALYLAHEWAVKFGSTDLQNQLADLTYEKLKVMEDE